MVQWAHAAAAMGEGFCASPQAATGFRSTITSQTRGAFDQLHAANPESLHSMLDRELWRSVPLPSTSGVPRLLPWVKDPCAIFHKCEGKDEKNKQQSTT